jgi:ubiquinone/menaquinone biosynthesis C-methylase UbiE
MEYQLEQIREQQRASWNKFSPGWKKWDRLFMDFLEPMGQALIKKLNPADNDLVLDVASGTGEPGLTIASSLKGGNVVVTDLSEHMLEIARENAQLRGIRNIETVACDAGELPFVDDQFDAVCCRLGYMFFPDMQLAANEMARVLKRGGRIATSVWNVPEKNFWITAMMTTLQQNMEVPAPPPGAPGMFRCSKPGLMETIFKKAGFKNISVHEVTGKLKCLTADTYWNVMTELAAPVVAALDKADDITRVKIKREVIELVSKRYAEGQVEIESSALVIYGEK